MPSFDSDAIVRAARESPAPAGWRVLPLQRTAAWWDLAIRIIAGFALLVICAFLAASAQASADGGVPYVFAAFALLASLAYFAAAWTPLQQARHPDEYLLVLTPTGVALAWAARASGLPFTSIADVSLRRRSFRAIFGHDLILTRDDGSELALPIGELFGEPNELLSTVIERTREARGLPSVSAE